MRKIIHSLKLVDYLHVQVDNPWYNYYLAKISSCRLQAENKDSVQNALMRKLVSIFTVYICPLIPYAEHRAAYGQNNSVKAHVE